MCDEVGVSRVGNDAIESVDKSQLSICFAEQKKAGIGSDGATAEVGGDGSSARTGKGRGWCDTVCHAVALVRVLKAVW